MQPYKLICIPLDRLDDLHKLENISGEGVNFFLLFAFTYIFTFTFQTWHLIFTNFEVRIWGHITNLESEVDTNKAFEPISALDNVSRLRIWSVGTFDEIEDDHHGSVKEINTAT